jgi:hypothetical protein
MANLRPAVKEDDSFLSKIVKYIPAEIIAVYTAIAGVLKPAANAGPIQIDVHRYMYVLIFLIIITPIWTYFAVLGNSDIITEPPTKKQRAIFHATVATIAFVIWVYAIGDILFRCMLCGCYFIPGADAAQQAANLKVFNDLLNGCTAYDSKLGAIILILYTGLLVPLFEFIILKKPIPPMAKAGVALDSQAQEIIKECERDFEAYKSDCSGFVKAVATKFGVDLTGQADSIVDQIQSAGWTTISDGVNAKEKADDGWLVIGGLKSVDHNPPRNNGHVVIVVSGPLANGKYPTGYWGTLGGVGRKNSTINYAWRETDRDKVVYAGKMV